jgi:hypothetical protein
MQGNFEKLMGLKVFSWTTLTHRPQNDANRFASHHVSALP